MEVPVFNYYLEPEEIYAITKKRKEGGLFEDYISEYDRKLDRMRIINEDKGIIRKCDVPGLEFAIVEKNLKQLGLVEKLPETVKYGLDYPRALYRRYLITPKDNLKELAHHLNLNEKEFLNLITKLENLLGNEYISLLKSVLKYFPKQFY